MGGRRSGLRGRAAPRPFKAAAGRIRLLLFDVDGVLTDGKIILAGDGSETKQFDVRDGTAIALAERAGLTTGLLSARQSAATAARAAQLGMRIVRQGVSNKIEAYDQLLRENGFSDAEVAYMGDDLLDLPVLGRVGLSSAPADASPEVIARVDWVSRRRGGDGAVREFIEAVLVARREWQALVDGFVAGGR